jgi:hypothetical protein
MQYPSGIPRWVILFKIVHASVTSTLCDAMVRLRIAPPMIALYRDIAVSTKLRRV